MQIEFLDAKKINGSEGALKMINVDLLIIPRCRSCRIKLRHHSISDLRIGFFPDKAKWFYNVFFLSLSGFLDPGPHTLSSSQRGCWPTSWESSLCVLGGSCATWSPRRTTDVLQTQRRSLCLSTSRLWLKASPPARPDRRKKVRAELSKVVSRCLATAVASQWE